jgi:tetratricopeptide (TPR) repeat protein
VLGICAVVVATGCKSGGGARPAPAPVEAAPPAPVTHEAAKETKASGEPATAGQDASCKPSGAACFDRAQVTSEKEPSRAERELERCLGCEDAPPASYRLLATLREDRNAKIEAREALMLGIRRHPASAVLWLGLARLELSLGHSKQGLEAMASAHRLMPSDEDVEREYKAALAHYGTDEDRLSADIDRLILEAAGRAELDDFKGALDTLQMALIKAARVHHLTALVQQRMGLVHLRQGDRKAAAAVLEKALALEKDPTPLRAEALVSYAEALLGTNRADDAIKAAEQAIAIEPKNPLAHANLGIARAMKNDREGAMKALAAACDYGLSRRLTLTEFLAIGPPIEKLKAHPEFAPMLKRAWPKSPYPPPEPQPPQPPKKK